MTESGLAFIASHLALDLSVVVPLIPRYVFRAATDDEIASIRVALGRSLPADGGSWVAYEGVVLEERGENGSRTYVEQLPREEWKYWVIAFDGSNDELNDLETVAQLLPFAFDVGFVLFYDQPGQRGVVRGRQLMPRHVVERYGGLAAWENAERVSVQQIASLGRLFEIFTTLAPDYSFIRSAMKNFSDLRRIPAMSDLYVVGLFSIIESLITHAPRLSETLDSINHQIVNKVILLRKRFSRSILPASYFMHASEESIWKKLYAYRSAVAHGTPISLEKSELQVLKGRDQVIKFLSDNVKELLLLSFREPEFISDLRKC